MTFALILGWSLFVFTLLVLILFIIGFVKFIKRFNLSKSQFDKLMTGTVFLNESSLQSQFAKLKGGKK